MKVFCALIVALGLTSCTQDAGMYAGVVILSKAGHPFDSDILGVALSKEKCEAGVAEAAHANPVAPDGMGIAFYCAPLGAPVVSVGK